MSFSGGNLCELAYNDLDYKNSTDAALLLFQNNPEPKTISEYVEAVSLDLDPDCKQFLLENKDSLQLLIDTTRAQKDDYFSAITYKEMFSISRDSKWFETPRYVWLRVAVQLYRPNLEQVTRCYRELMAGLYTPSTPTIIGSSTNKASLAACYLGTISDSRKGIHFDGLYRASEVLSLAGGFGIDISRIRHSEMSNGIVTGGIVPLVQLFNAEVNYIRGKRKGTITLLLNCWHLDTEDFCNVVKKMGDRKVRAHDINIGLWTYNLFWKRLSEDGNWTFFCPAAVPELLDTYGEKFEELYLAAEQNPNIPANHKKTIKAKDFYLSTIYPNLNQTGMPYIMNRDTCNFKSNHKHLGLVGTNVCLEIIQHVSETSSPVCNLHSISLRKFAKCRVNTQTTKYDIKECYDFRRLAEITHSVVSNVNRMMETGQYPLDDKGKKGQFHQTNDNNLPIAIGIAGLADTLYKLDLTFTSSLTRDFNKMLSACIYFNALAKSVDLAITEGPYPTFEGSPISQGKFQFDLWREEFEKFGPNPCRKAEDDEPVNPELWGQERIELCNGEYIEPSWQGLREAILKYGIRNSLVTGYMPTATSAHLRRNTESFEPPLSSIITRRTTAGSFTVMNRHMIKDLKEIGLWNEHTAQIIKKNNGSLQKLPGEITSHPELYPSVFDNSRLQYLCEKYRTVWEIPQKQLMILCADRSRYVDQSCSFNIYMKDSTPERAIAAHLSAAKMGLKTLSYYWRTPSISSEKLTIVEANPRRNYVCDGEVCTACSS